MIDRWLKFGSVEVYGRKFCVCVCVCVQCMPYFNSKLNSNRQNAALKLEDLRA